MGFDAGREPMETWVVLNPGVSVGTVGILGILCERWDVIPGES